MFLCKLFGSCLIAVPVQLIVWKDLTSKMTHHVLSETLNSTHSLTHSLTHLVHFVQMQSHQFNSVHHMCAFDL